MLDFDGRTQELLEAVRRTGSLAAAAREVGLDPSNARRHLRTAAERRGAPLVQSEKGGAVRGLTRLTPEGRALVRPARGWTGRAEAFDAATGTTLVSVGARRLAVAGRVPEGPVRLEWRPEDVTLERPRPDAPSTSARNAVPARVHRIREAGEGTFRVALVAGALRLDATLTRGALREMRLREGSRVVARLKATAMRAAPL